MRWSAGSADEGPLELVVIGKLPVVVSARRRLEAGAEDFSGATPVAPRQVATGIDQQPMQPGLEPIRLAQAAKVAPATHDGVLGGVLGGRSVAEDPVGDRKQAVVGRADDRFERGVIAPLRLPDQICGHRSPRRGAVICRADEYGVAPQRFLHRLRRKLDRILRYLPIQHRRAKDQED